MATAAQAKYTPSKKRYNKQALDWHNSEKEFGHMFYLNRAAECRENINLRHTWILDGEGHWFRSYFNWRSRYRRNLHMSKEDRGVTIPLPG